MSTSIEALREAVTLEKSALEKVKTAIGSAIHDQTKTILEKYVADKEQKIDTLSWMIMAESGDLKPEADTAEAAPKAEGAEGEKPAGKCPFSGMLAEMGIDINTMGKDMKPHE